MRFSSLLSSFMSPFPFLSLSEPDANNASLLRLNCVWKRKWLWSHMEGGRENHLYIPFSLPQTPLPSEPGDRVLHVPMKKGGGGSRGGGEIHYFNSHSQHLNTQWGVLSCQAYWNITTYMYMYTCRYMFSWLIYSKAVKWTKRLHLHIRCSIADIQFSDHHMTKTWTLAKTEQHDIPRQSDSRQVLSYTTYHTCNW